MRAAAFDVAAPAVPERAAVRRPPGRGRPLDPAVRARMAAAFGTGFDAVRVHTDAPSDAFNQDVSALASTVGEHVYFRSGAYRPGTGAGMRLLAHELSHVVQQRGSSGGAPRLGPVGGPAEAQADAAAARVASGGTVDAGSLAPVAAGTVQRKYLDAASPDAAVSQFKVDTTRHKKGVSASRGKLRRADRLLGTAMGYAPAVAAWTTSLAALDTELASTKYATQAKTSGTFVRRRDAIAELRQEIAGQMPPVGPPPPLPAPVLPPPLVLPSPPVGPPPALPPGHGGPPGYPPPQPPVQAPPPPPPPPMQQVHVPPPPPPPVQHGHVPPPPPLVHVPPPPPPPPPMQQVPQVHVPPHPVDVPPKLAAPPVKVSAHQDVLNEHAPPSAHDPSPVWGEHSDQELPPPAPPPVEEPSSVREAEPPSHDEEQSAQADETEVLRAQAPRPQRGRGPDAGPPPHADGYTADDIAQKDPAEWLKEIGFTRAFIAGVDGQQVHDLHAVSVALRAGRRIEAQALLDRLSPPNDDPGWDEGIVRPLGWAFEAHRPAASIEWDKQGESRYPIYDFGRTDSSVLAAARQLLVYHASDIGGTYGQLMSYKPFNPSKQRTPLTSAHIYEATKYQDSDELRGWHTTIQGADDPDTLLDNVIKKQSVVETALYQSAADERQKAKGLPPKERRKTELLPEEIVALRIYTADVYREINAVFRDFRVDQPTQNWAKYSAIARIAISALGKLPKARDAISFRGDNDTQFAGADLVLKQGATFRAPCFYSTTTDVNRAFDGVVGSVFKNTKRGRDIRRYSAYIAEGEILVPPGTPFRIIQEWNRDPSSDVWTDHDGNVGPPTGHAAKLLGKDSPKRTRILVFEEIG